MMKSSLTEQNSYLGTVYTCNVTNHVHVDYYGNRFDTHVDETGDVRTT